MVLLFLVPFLHFLLVDLLEGVLVVRLQLLELIAELRLESLEVELVLLFHLSLKHLARFLVVCVYQVDILSKLHFHLRDLNLIFVLLHAHLVLELEVLPIQDQLDVSDPFL